jgi:hypothetical protein
MPGQVKYEIDAQARTLSIAIIGEVSGRQALVDIPKIWQSHPETAGYHCVVDLMRDEGALPWSVLREISEKWREFTSAEESHARTALVVRDKFWEKLAAVVSPLFPASSFKVFQSMDAAREWLLHPPCSQQVG